MKEINFGIRIASKIKPRQIGIQKLKNLITLFFTLTQNLPIMAITKETFRIEGEKLLKKVKELINEGNIRKITIQDKDGKEIMSFPLTIGVVGTVFAPVLVAVGAIAAVIGECAITIEKEVQEK